MARKSPFRHIILVRAAVAATLLAALAGFVAVPARPAAAEAGDEDPFLSPFLDRTYHEFDTARRLHPERDAAGEDSATVWEFGPDDISALHMRDLASLLTLVPGMHVTNGEWIGRRQRTIARSRGFDATKIAVIIDGVPVGDALLGSEDLSRISLAGAALVRVVQGPLSLRYDTGRAAAVVEIFTRHAGDEFTGAFGVDLGDREAGWYRLWFGDTQEAFTYAASASHDDRESAPAPAELENEFQEAHNGAIRGTARRRDAFRGRAGVEIPRVINVYATGSYDEDVTELPNEIGGRRGVFDRFGYRRRATAQLNLFSNPVDEVEIGGVGYVHEDLVRRDVAGAANFDDNTRTQHHQRDLIFGAALWPTLDFGRWSRVRLTGEIRRGDVETWIEADPRVAWTLSSLHAAIEDDIRPTNWLAFTFGGGFDRATLARESATGVTLETDPYENPACRAGIVVTPYKGGTLHVSASQTSRHPTPDQVLTPEFGDRELEAETIRQAELGLRQRWPRHITTTLVGFGHQVDGAIGYATSESGDKTGPHVDLGEVVSGGGTAAIAAAPFEGLHVRADYTFEQSRETDASRDAFFQPRHLANVLAGYRFPFGLGAMIGYEYVGAWDDPQTEAIGGQPFYSLLHAKISYTYRELFELYVAGDNLTDVYYETARRYPMPGRFLHGGVELRF